MTYPPTFQSERFKGVVDEAIQFFERTPVFSLPPADSFAGSGVYALYYAGSFPLYRKLTVLNRENPTRPIYVGKTTPPGWRTGRAILTPSRVLFSRLRQHAWSVAQTTNLALPDFRCRLMILAGMEGDIVVPVEAELIRRHRPLWNGVVDGFGKHDPGRGRHNQANSDWDVLHPGRAWAARLTGPANPLAEIEARVSGFLG